VVVGALVGPADDGDDEIGVLPDLRVATGGLSRWRCSSIHFWKSSAFQHGGAALTV